MSEAVLDIQHLRVAFPGAGGIVRAVEDVSLRMERGECLALVGESGCGKSVTARAVLRLLDPQTAVVRTKTHMLSGREISGYTDREMEDLRGRAAAMIFQDALSALNPVMTVGAQLDEIFFRHMQLSKREAKKRSVEALSMVGVPDPEARYRAYPHELSGGMRQRVLIAMAFACDPDLIIADEPTTALDVTIQAQVLDTLRRMQKEHRTALLLISHDLGVVSRMADRIAVMYSGKIVEEAPCSELLGAPRHPYTQGLLRSVVRLSDSRERFAQIPGALPDPVKKPEGCYFFPRCPQAAPECAAQMPRLEPLKERRHRLRCICREERKP